MIILIIENFEILRRDTCSRAIRFPTRRRSPGGRGCLQLLRDGAKLVRDVDDILEELGPLHTLQRDMFAAVQQTLPASGSLTSGAGALLELIGFESCSLDELVSVSPMPLVQVMAQLSTLELEGLIRRCPGGYIRC